MSDAQRWDERWSAVAEPGDIVAPPLLERLTPAKTTSPRTVDLACGLGDAGLTLAARGHQVTFVDVSQQALDIVDRRATQRGLDIELRCIDLASTSPPAGPWDVAVLLHYLDRPLLGQLRSVMAAEGRLACAIATTTNLERHERPSRRFLLEPDELPALLGSGWVIEHHDEQWRANDAHEAWLVARASDSV